ncbi:TetR-like C-terminal domain-containing protein [Falsirhodobacter sp. alg1]|uniref:TetR-like C-terminal domain-containing protein n=1 Tax=Falsirhodobacter sp. alg1 TaxID=1472418 RepID=UPI0005EDCC2E|nr:TetR-like C-terminal domain-containing protein [Falsirhodobacter sp. alg1]
MGEQKRMGGRPRDAEAAGAIKAATLKLLRENGYGAVSIAAIAAEAGVARQTLYNRWNAKADLVLDALYEETGRYAAAPLTECGLSFAAQLEAFLVQVFDHLTEGGGPVRSLIAAAQEDPAFRKVFKERFVRPREQMITDILARARQCGELAADRDIGMLSAFVHGAFWYALLNDDPMDAAFAHAITTEVFRKNG